MHVWHILYSDVLTIILAIIIILTYLIGQISNGGTTIKIAYTNNSHQSLCRVGGPGQG